MNVVTNEERESLSYLSAEHWSLYCFLRNFMAYHKRAPSYREIGEELRISRQTVHRRLRDLRWLEVIGFYYREKSGTAVPEVETQQEPEPEPRKVKSMLIQEPELTALANLEAGQPFTFPEEEVPRVLVRARGDAGDRGAANLACIILAVDGEANQSDVGTVISVVKTAKVQQLELIQSPLYRKV